MTIDPASIRCDCGALVRVIDRATGQFTCATPACKHHGKVFRPKRLLGLVDRVKGADWKPELSESHGEKI